MNVSLGLSSSFDASSYVKRESSFSVTREVSTPYTTEQKVHAVGFATLQILGLLVFGAIAGIIIGATCAKTQTVVALPGKTELSFTGHVFLPMIACLVLGIFGGAYLAFKAIKNPEKYLEDLVDEQINKKANEIENEESPFKKAELQKELDKLYASRENVARNPFEIESRLYDWGATKIAATLVS